MYKYKATIIRVIDSDTVECEIDLGFKASLTLTLRVINFDGPESWRPRNEAEKIHALAANDRARELLDNQEVIITTYKPDKYGRYLADIAITDGEDYATKMIYEGFSKRDSY